MKYDFTHFTDELSKIKCTLNNLQLEQFELYYDMLIEKNKVMNLTAICSEGEFIAPRPAVCWKPMPTVWGSCSRSWTMCWTSPARRNSWANPSAATAKTAKRPLPPCTVCRVQWTLHKNSTPRPARSCTAILAQKRRFWSSWHSSFWCAKADPPIKS